MRGLRKSWAAMSRLDSPRAASRATCSSCGVSRGRSARPGGGTRVVTVGRGQLHQAKRVAPSLSQNPAAGLSRQPSPVLIQQRRRRGRIQPAQPQLRQPRRGQRRVVVPRREDDHDPLGVQPPGREHQRLRRRPVQPVRVVDQAQQRTILGQLSQQTALQPQTPHPRRGAPAHPPRRAPRRPRHCTRHSPTAPSYRYPGRREPPAPRYAPHEHQQAADPPPTAPSPAHTTTRAPTSHDRYASGSKYRRHHVVAIAHAAVVVCFDFRMDPAT